MFGDEPRFYKDLKPLYEGGGLFALGEVRLTRSEEYSLLISVTCFDLLAVIRAFYAVSLSQSYHLQSLILLLSPQIIRLLKPAPTLVQVFITLKDWKTIGDILRTL